MLVDTASFILRVPTSTGVLISRMIKCRKKLLGCHFSLTIPKMPDVYIVINTPVTCDASASEMTMLENSTDGTLQWDKHVQVVRWPRRKAQLWQSYPLVVIG